MVTHCHKGERWPAIAGPVDFAAAFAVSRRTLDRLESYERLLRQWQPAVNLVSASTLAAIWHRHFADSAQLVNLAPAAQTWVDLGSGAGFPGMVVAIVLADGADALAAAPLAAAVGGRGTDATLEASATARPPPRVSLVEGDSRKAAFLRTVARQSGIAVDILSTRIERAATQSKLQPADVVMARALAPLDKLLGLAAPWFSSRTVGLFLKGREAAREVEAARRMWAFDSVLIPSRTEAVAHIVRVSRFEPNRKEPRS
jgi:16S rRNA (guanine527-N7)-methyltransferase